jgi:formyl-CoA transferase
MAGPFCAMLLADLGADVVKIEPPGGEATRRMGLELAPGHSAPFLAVNRNKRGLVLDLKRPDGARVLERLAAGADVLVENYRPGVAHRLGIDYPALAAVNPRLVYCSISGFGRTGPYAARGGYDLIAQGMSGIMSATGSEGGPPVKVGVPVADLGAALFGVLGILAALRARRTTGRGQLVDTSLFEAAVALSPWEATEYWFTGETPGRLGTAHRLNAPYQAFRASDGYFTAGASNERLWPRFCRVLGLDELPADPRFDTLAGRLRHRVELEAVVEAVTSREPRAHWLARCEAAGIPAGPINSVPEAHADPQAKARGMVQELEHPSAGRVKCLGNPVKMSKSPPSYRKAAPLLGEDTVAILRELGYTEADVARLAGERVIRTAEPSATPAAPPSVPPAGPSSATPAARSRA